MKSISAVLMREDGLGGSLAILIGTPVPSSQRRPRSSHCQVGRFGQLACLPHSNATWPKTHRSGAGFFFFALPHCCSHVLCVQPVATWAHAHAARGLFLCAVSIHVENVYVFSLPFLEQLLVRMQSSEHALRVQESNAKGRETLPPIHHHASIHWPQSHGMACPVPPWLAQLVLVLVLVLVLLLVPVCRLPPTWLPGSPSPYATNCTGMRCDAATTKGPSCCDTRRPLLAATMDASALQRSVPE